MVRASIPSLPSEQPSTVPRQTERRTDSYFGTYVALAVDDTQMHEASVILVELA